MQNDDKIVILMQGIFPGEHCFARSVLTPITDSDLHDSDVGSSSGEESGSDNEADEKVVHIERSNEDDID